MVADAYTSPPRCSLLYNSRGPQKLRRRLIPRRWTRSNRGSQQPNTLRPNSRPAPRSRPNRLGSRLAQRLRAPNPQAARARNCRWPRPALHAAPREAARTGIGCRDPQCPRAQAGRGTAPATSPRPDPRSKARPAKPPAPVSDAGCKRPGPNREPAAARCLIPALLHPPRVIESSPRGDCLCFVWMRTGPSSSVTA